MNSVEIMKSIEDAQVRKEELKLNVGDTVRVSAMIKEGNSYQEAGYRRKKDLYST